MRLLYKSGLLLIFLWAWLTGTAAFAASVAVFPLQELGEGRNDANLPLTRRLTEKLVATGNEVISLKTVISFMAHNRVRTLGHLESFYISRVRSDLGASFILLGTVSQRRESPEPSLGLTLNLVRASDGRTVWTHVDCAAISDQRRLLGVGEPRTVADLESILLEELAARWPWQIINEAQQVGSIYIDQAWVEPRQIRPGQTVRAEVRLRDIWGSGQLPQVFFRVEDQLYQALPGVDRLHWKASWTAARKNGNYPVTLLLEWPHYGRSETALLGSYLVDGTPPLFEIELRGSQLLDGRPVFNRAVVIVPRLLVRKQTSRWKLTFFSEEGDQIGKMEEEGQLPESLVWAGRGKNGPVSNGSYQMILEAWDLAGNSARAEQWLELNRNLPEVSLSINKGDAGVSVDLAQSGKLPLEIWRMEMWTREGRIVASEEGKELPVKIDLDIADITLSDDLEGYVFVQDILGNRVRRTIKDLLPNLAEAKVEKIEEKKDVSQKWVDEF